MLTTLTYSVRELVAFINWLYFFYAWQIPTSLTESIVNNAEAKSDWDEKARAQFLEGKKLFADVQKILEEFGKKFSVKCRVGLFKAYSQNDDIVIITDSGDEITLPCLRQQHSSSNKPHLCLSDFIAPLGSIAENQIGVFASTIDEEMEKSHSNDAYLHLISQTLSDRLAEAATEKAHLEVRKNLWGYAPHEDLPIKDLFAEKFDGIRPAVGYPSLPDQSINFILDQLIDMKGLGIRITENGAMQPHASVSGLMFAHPQAHYFSIGKIGKDQLEDYAQRRKLPLERMRQFLSANL